MSIEKTKMIEELKSLKSFTESAISEIAEEIRKEDTPIRKLVLKNTVTGLENMRKHSQQLIDALNGELVFEDAPTTEEVFLRAGNIVGKFERIRDALIEKGYCKAVAA